MSDPRRMLDSNVPPHIRLLLEAARSAGPDSSLVETTLQSVRSAELGATSSGLLPLSSSAVIPLLVGLLSLGALVGVGWTVMAPALPNPQARRVATPTSLRTSPAGEEPAEGVEASIESQSDPSAQARANPVGSARSGEAPRSSSDAAPPRNSPASRAPAQPVAPVPSVAQDASRERSRSSTMAQRDLVLRARAALDGGHPQQALAILAGYEASFDELRFVPEVLSLRMQAYQRTGSIEAAKQLARRIVATYPLSSQAGRARQLLRDREARGEMNESGSP